MPEQQPESLTGALLELDAITRRLRRDCPWDREQDERSIVPHTVEEAYELAEAAHAGDDAKLLDELGDVLFQVYFLSLLLEERGQGDLRSVATAVTEKLVRRHPHVFGDDERLAQLPTEAATPAEVRRNWDEIKRSEPGRAADRIGEIPANLPALLYARKLHKRAGRQIDLDRSRQALRQSLERIPTEHAGGHGSPAEYELIGELLSELVELSRALEVDPEVALRRAADTFRAQAETEDG